MRPVHAHAAILLTKKTYYTKDPNMKIGVAGSVGVDVSCVVNVFEATINSVVCGSQTSNACAKCVPSILETK